MVPTRFGDYIGPIPRHIVNKLSSGPLPYEYYRTTLKFSFSLIEIKKIRKSRTKPSTITALNSKEGFIYTYPPQCGILVRCECCSPLTGTCGNNFVVFRDAAVITCWLRLLLLTAASALIGLDIVHAHDLASERCAADDGNRSISRPSEHQTLQASTRAAAHKRRGRS